MNDVNNAHSAGLAFATAEECQAWLATQPLASTVQMQSVLQRQLGLLNRTDMRATVRLSILEALREQIYRTQEECQARFARRPVPLAIPEQAAYDASQATWQSLADGYVRCLESLLSGEVGIHSRAATIVERIMVTLIDMQADMYRGSQLPPASHWRALHQCLAAAEQLGVADTTVKDKLHNAERSMSTQSLYVEAMLLHMASPTETSARQMTWLARWARRWAKKVVPVAEAPSAAASAPIYVALDSDEPAGHVPIESEHVRIFDTSELRLSLKKRLHLLSKGESPESLQLGDDCSLPAAGILLEKTYQRWCKLLTQPRKHERRNAQSDCFAICGFDKAQEVFRATAGSDEESVDLERLRREREQTRTLAESVAAPAPATVVAEGEAWQVLDQSASGLRMLRPFVRGQQRIAIGMLMALRFRPDANEHVLSCVRWTMVREDGSVEIGVEILPGVPQLIAVSGMVKGSRTPARGRAFLLPAIPTLKESSSLVIPHGWFEPGRMIDIVHGTRQTVRLGQPLERGKDFDRVTFSEAAAAAA